MHGVLKASMATLHAAPEPRVDGQFHDEAMAVLMETSARQGFLQAWIGASLTLIFSLALLSLLDQA